MAAARYGVAIVIPDRVEVRKPTLILGNETMMTTATMALVKIAEKGADVAPGNRIPC